MKKEMYSHRGKGFQKMKNLEKDLENEIEEKSRVKMKRVPYVCGLLEWQVLNRKIKELEQNIKEHFSFGVILDRELYHAEQRHDLDGIKKLEKNIKKEESRYFTMGDELEKLQKYRDEIEKKSMEKLKGL